MLSRPIVKKTINLYEGDFERLNEIHRPNGVDASEVIRRLIVNHIAEIDRKIAEGNAPDGT